MSFAILRLVVLSLLTALVAAPARPAETAENLDPKSELVGVWAGERRFGRAVSGDLLLRLEDEVWRAEVAGYRMEVEDRGGELRFELPGDAGSFRGQLELDTGSILGHWVQPGVVSMFGQRFATPLHLRPSGSGLWVGPLRPLEDRARVFLVIGEEEGKLRAFLRNPEVNFGPVPTSRE